MSAKALQSLISKAFTTRYTSKWRDRLEMGTAAQQDAAIRQVLLDVDGTLAAKRRLSAQEREFRYFIEEVRQGKRSPFHMIPPEG